MGLFQLFQLLCDTFITRYNEKQISLQNTITTNSRNFKKCLPIKGKLCISITRVKARSSNAIPMLKLAM